MTTSNRRALSPQVSLSANLTFERARQRVSQAELAKRAGVSRYTIVRLESAEYANPGLEMLDKIARALDVTVHRLLRPARVDDRTPSDEELLRRMQDPESEFVDVDDLFTVIDESERAARQLGARRRYSNRGRRRVAHDRAYAEAERRLH
jgi:transcriptional regulator with XRE-family HTH domain